ncbi:hypothetical protein N7523_010037 [Penicillium sp. IBT 18751x]|nr:hypothetical protein N7523_010037 [Penicillium sp. IBT 18751x]
MQSLQADGPDIESELDFTAATLPLGPGFDRLRILELNALKMPNWLYKGRMAVRTLSTDISPVWVEDVITPDR